MGGVYIKKPALQLRKTRTWLLRRLSGGLVVLWAAATFTFVLQSLLPGGRAQLIINMSAGTDVDVTPAQIAAVNAKYGFDEPVVVQYLRYLGRIAHGDFGTSYMTHASVMSMIAAQIVPTIVLAAAALVMAWVIAIVFTVSTAGHRNLPSRAARLLQIVMATAPQYWLATIMLVVFAIQLQIFPVEGDDGVLGLVLPTFALAIPLAGFIGQIIQAEFEQALSLAFVTSARAKGVKGLAVRTRHVLRHAVLPGVSLSGWAIGQLFSGAVLIEAVFARPGIGGVLVAATSARDIPVVTGITIVSAAVYVGASILVDRAYVLIDPRMKLQ